MKNEKNESVPLICCACDFDNGWKSENAVEMQHVGEDQKYKHL